jgi:hypothetical protein
MTESAAANDPPTSSAQKGCEGQHLSFRTSLLLQAQRFFPKTDNWKVCPACPAWHFNFRLTTTLIGYKMKAN